MARNYGRNQLKRILDLIKILEQSSGCRVRDLARLYGVDQSRIYSDLKIIEGFYVLQRDKGVYWIKGERPRFNEKEVDALMAAINASPLSQGSPLEKPLKNIIKKLHLPLAQYIQSKIEEETHISIQLKAGNHSDEVEKYFTVLEEAIYKQKAVRASYQASGKAEPNVHVLHPYAIFFRKEDWYLEARSNLSEEESLTFKILRFQKVELTEERFEMPTEFSLAANLESRWELFSGEPLSMTLKIAAHKAYLVTEKERHPSQEIIERCADGAVIVRYEVPKTEFTFWVLSLGDAAEVLEPPEFRAEFQEIVRRMHEVYSGDR